ncbi:MAG: hypothetical protein LQ340_007235 [Diploschistes diacapsis]|nr:MAG: hypothetical protein LQ340_007235 [Diploschistes diacapsis]
MKVAASLLVGAATLAAAAGPSQVPLHGASDASKFSDKLAHEASESVHKIAGGTSHAVNDLRKSWHLLSDEAKATWEQVSREFPEEVSKLRFPQPKKAHRKPDSHWDYIAKGEDLQSLWVENAQGEKEREIEGRLAQYNLRGKRVQPNELGVDPNVTQYAGYLDDEEEDKHLFYWFFESRNNPETDPVVLWLNGGPGCSSLTGLFMELGPAAITRDGKVKHNPASWNSNASVIFLDQPVNVGFSYSSNSVSNTVAAGKDIYALLTLFFKQFPEYAKQDFHIAGESYAGHYIPVFTSEILSHKKRNINLQSVLIGNGLTDPYIQYEYYRPMACGEGAWPAVLDEQTCQSMDNALPRCQSLIESCYNSQSAWTCVPASIYCNNAILGPYQRTGMNPYDVREKCKGGNLCYEELDWISSWLNQDHVLEGLGAEVDSYEGCNFDINRNFLFQGDWMQPYHLLIPDILEEIPVLIYAGDADFICNYLGNRAWTEELKWSGKEAYNKERLGELKLEGKKVGGVKSSGNLTFVEIHAAGHMVPYNQPEASVDFFNRWLGGEWFGN